jgi:hypothetical protein
MKRLFISVFFGAAALTANAAAPVAKIQAMLAKPSVLCGRFDQTKQLAGMKKPLLSNGRFCVVNGKGVLWRTLQPFPDKIVHYQGERVANRLDAKTEPTVRMINSVLFSLLSGDLSQLDTLFETDGTADANGWHVALKARKPELAKAIGAITLDGKAYVKNITIAEASGDRTDIVFSEMKTGDAAMLPEEAALF